MTRTTRRPRRLSFVAVWLLTRGLMVFQLAYSRLGSSVDYQDLNVFRQWAIEIATTHQIPKIDSWQYPPGAIPVFLIPRATPNHYFEAFVVMALSADLLTTMALESMSRREGHTEGLWLWLLGIPTLGTLGILRFDLIPTCIAVVALTLSTQRRLFGVLVGLGMAVKAWPVLLLLSIKKRSDARAAAFAASAVVAVFMLASWLTLKNSFEFLGNQQHRGLELEAIAATPWYLRQAIFGTPVHWAIRNGSYEILSVTADLVAQVLHVSMLVLAITLATWWVKWTRRSNTASGVGRDAAFTALLLYVVVSEVLSPQYLIWLIGVGAVDITSADSQMRRPVLWVALSVVLTPALATTWVNLVTYGSVGASLLVMRNVALAVAAVDASLIMWRVVRPRTDTGG